MKSKLLNLTAAALMVFSISAKAQTYTAPATIQAPIFWDGFESWAGTPTQPTVWMQTPTTTMPASGVTQAVTTGTALAAEQGTYACNLQNTAATYSYMATAPVFTVTAGMQYQISYYVRGKGTLSAGIATGTVNAANGGEPVSGSVWHHVLTSVTAPATATNAAFFFKVKSTAVYSKNGISITGVDVDSFCVRPYTEVASADLASIQQSYTTSVTKFYGQQVGLTGGIVTGINIGSTGPSGYFLQTTGSTAWGAMQVFDFTTAPLVHVGDSVTFGGFVDNYYGQTQMSNLVNFSNVSQSSTPAIEYPIKPMLLTTQTINNRQYQSFLVGLQGVTINSYTASYGQATITDASGVPAVADFKDGFYPPNGTATSGSTGNSGWVPKSGTGSSQGVIDTTYCIIGNSYLNFGYNIYPRDSADITKMCTVLPVAGIAKYNNALHAMVYPNPASNQLNIELANEASKVSVSFTDVLGKEVMTLNNLSGSMVAINDLSLPAGVYMVRITADNNTQIVKVVKQ